MMAPSTSSPPMASPPRRHSRSFPTSPPWLKSARRILARSSVSRFRRFCRIFPGTDGLLHISEISEARVNTVRDELNEGDQILVKVLALEGNKIKLSRRAVLAEQRDKLRQGDGVTATVSSTAAAPASQDQPRERGDHNRDRERGGDRDRGSRRRRSPSLHYNQSNRRPASQGRLFSCGTRLRMDAPLDFCLRIRPCSLEWK